MKDPPRLYVKNAFEAVQVIEFLQLKGFRECYARNPATGKRLKIDTRVLKIVAAEKRLPTASH